MARLALSRLKLNAGKPVIKGVPNTVLAVGGVSVGVLAVYLASKAGLLPRDFPNFSIPGPVSPNGAGINFSVLPAIVEQGKSFVLSGSEKGPDGNAKVATTMYYYIYGDASSFGQQRLFASGTVGQNISDFNLTLSSAQLPPGDYTIYVSDTPMAVAGSSTSGNAIPVQQQSTVAGLSPSVTLP